MSSTWTLIKELLINTKDICLSERHTALEGSYLFLLYTARQPLVGQVLPFKLHDHT